MRDCSGLSEFKRILLFVPVVLSLGVRQLGANAN